MIRHSFDAISFAFGLLFVGLAVLAPNREWLPDDVGRWVVPVAVLILGGGLAFSALKSSRGGDRSGDQVVE
jgi:hypothetical protein